GRTLWWYRTPEDLRGGTTMTPDTRTRTAPPGRRSWFTALLDQPSVRITVFAWTMAIVAVVALARGHLPFHRPAMHHASFGNQLLAPNLAMLEVFLLMAVVFALTRRRAVPDVGARAPERAVALRQTLWMVGYGVAGLRGGLLL